ncbi:Pentatricopeptide repeat-containing protein [Actinidia chinensis var. chinensis]|uniref:Pentatricopeptide repeat-containing protein n=1 Tax=Actinidia chinensis var. chinensis TaxID=1590841 RepID=A0A2R6QX60_ACTCC|nr:Pentatricopeptide repeat-containing protein [Actinidia chinensis var. chinensis]
MKLLRSWNPSNLWGDCCNGVISRGFKEMFYSTQTLTNDSLYKRISVAGDPRVSMLPILDQWVEGGRTVDRSEIKTIINFLRKFKRFKHALQLSEWMSRRWNLDPSPGDIAVQLDLVLKVHGLESAEKYFRDIPDSLKTFHVYRALLICYANEKSLGKAEAIMQKMTEFRMLRNSLPYNVMLNLYSKLGNQEKFDALIQEMEEKGISWDTSTLHIRLNKYAAVSDINGMEKLLSQMEDKSQFTTDWNAYITAANGYLKAGLAKQSLEMLKKSEQHIDDKRRGFAYEMLLTLYASLGNKDELNRIWNLYKKMGKVYNRGYFRMISSLIKLSDLNGAENMLMEWESRNTSFDFDIPNLLINAYCKKGLLEKAEAYISRAIERGNEPTTGTYDRLATAYHKNKQIEKAVEAMKKAIQANRRGWELNCVTLTACVEYLKKNGDIELAEEFMRLLPKNGR